MSRAALAPALRLAAAAALLTGCASALKPLDPDSELGRPAAAANPAAASELAASAEAQYARRPQASAVAAAEKLWLEAALADPAAAEAVIGLTRARIWLARNVGIAEERAAKATAAVETAQQCAERQPENPDCPYWLALAVGVQAEQRRVTAVDGLKVMIELLQEAIDRHETLDHAGPRRVLAMVLVRAPGWPTGPGDPDAGLVEARRAVELDSEYPPNLLALASAYAAVEQRAASRRQYRAALAAATAWRERGHPDAVDWVEEAAAALD